MAQILLVDDNPSLLAIYGELLKSAGHELHTANDGQVGIGLLRGGLTPDLVLLDMEMPVMNGVQTITAIRDDAALAALRVIALTSHELPDQVDEALDAGCDGYLVKPTDPSTLIHEVKFVLDEVMEPL